MSGRTGQLSKRSHGYGFGGGGIGNAKKGAPLRKIIAIVVSYGNIFAQDLVLLECGHKTSSNAIYRAHCPSCKAGCPPEPIE